MELSEIEKKIFKSKPADWEKFCYKGKELIFLKEDINIRFEKVGDKEKFEESWLKGVSESYAYNYCLYYSSLPIKIFKLVHIDNNQAILPIPEIKEPKSLDNKLKVIFHDYFVAKIHDTHNTLDQYMDKLNIEKPVRAGPHIRTIDVGGRMQR